MQHPKLFMLMLGCAFVIEDSLRKVGRAGLNGVRTSVNARRAAAQPQSED